MKSKKAQGLSMNTIIIAAIGLAVLVILFAVFTGRIGIFSEGVQNAEKIDCPAFCKTSGYGDGSTTTQDATCSGTKISTSNPESPCCCTG